MTDRMQSYRIAGPIAVEMLEKHNSHPSRAEAVLCPNQTKEVEFVKSPKGLFTEVGPEILAYMPSI